MISRLDVDGKRISEHEDMSTEISQTKNRINTKVKVSVSCSVMSHTNIKIPKDTHKATPSQLKNKTKNHEETLNEKDLLMADKHIKEIQ